MNFLSLVVLIHARQTQTRTSCFRFGGKNWHRRWPHSHILQAFFLTNYTALGLIPIPLPRAVKPASAFDFLRPILSLRFVARARRRPARSALWRVHSTQTDYGKIVPGDSARFRHRQGRGLLWRSLSIPRTTRLSRPPLL